MKKFVLILIALGILGFGYAILSEEIGNENKELTVLSWDDYIGPTTIHDFEQVTGAHITYEVIKSNEEALARLKANPGVYDVVVISDYMVNSLRDAKSLLMLNKAKIPNVKNIGINFRNKYFDPTGSYSAAYAYGTTGFAVNTKEFPKSVITWKELTDPKYKGKIGMIDDMRYVLGSILIELGYSPNTTNPEEIAAAKALLRSVMPNVQKITDGSPIDLMVNESMSIAYAWSGDILQMHTQNADIDYQIPPTGSLIFQDSMVIPSDATHADLAHQYINFILDPKVSASITNEIQYGNPNTEALPLIDESIRTSPIVFPSASTLKKLEYIKDVGEDMKLYEKAWESIKQ